MAAFIILGLVVALAVVNGANDNSKGVATLIGSGVTSPRIGLLWAALTTGAGSIAAAYLAQGLLAAFSGKGLVPDAVAGSASFAGSVAIGAVVAVGLATRLGLPISTTHGLVGGLLGAGAVAAPHSLMLGGLLKAFVAPLLLSPVLAFAATMAFAPLARIFEARVKPSDGVCVCVTPEPMDASGSLAATSSVTVGTASDCDAQAAVPIATVTTTRLIDGLHVLSSGAVSFARGLNDTVKIAALLTAGGLLANTGGIVLVAVAMACGGLLLSRGVAETMARRITTMSPGFATGGNIVTATLVISASLFALPVSTTHVSCGALFGVGAVSGTARWTTIRQILAAWLLTLPIAAAVSAVAMTIWSAV